MARVGPPPRVVLSDADGTVPPRIVRDTPIAFHTDRLLAPRSVSRSSVQLVSGGTGVFGRLRYDPARRRVEFVTDPGALRAGVEYVLIVRDGLLAWDGAPFAGGYQRRLVADEAVAPPPARPTRPALRADVLPIFSARCATSGCHTPPHAVMGLDLSSADAVVRTAVNVASVERAGTGAIPPERADPQWGAMFRIDAGRAEGEGEPAYSYLVYKLLGDGPVLGSRMPPEGHAALSDDDIARISDWIRRGAPDD